MFNLHPSKSYTAYRIGTFWGGRYRCVLDSDDWSTGGHSRIDHKVVHESTGEPWQERPNFLEIYSPSRTVQVYHCFETWEEIEAGKKAVSAEATAEAVKIREGDALADKLKTGLTVNGGEKAATSK